LVFSQLFITRISQSQVSSLLSNALKLINKGAAANQLFRNSDFFQTHVHLGTLTFEKNQNHKNFLKKLDFRQRLKAPRLLLGININFKLFIL
jgi:hypothetical protein